jgi:ABC-2 type transport system ATP-binding protein
MIDISDLGFAYTRRDKPLFAQLNLHLRAGTICGMLGPNGAGKSTLLKILAGLTYPQQGSCRVLGYTPAERQPEFLADIFLLPEEIFVPQISAIEYARRYGNLYPRFTEATFTTLLAEFALPVDKKLHTLSYGQKKKFLLAFGIATNARLLIMDEPTNGLDIPGKSQFRRVLINHFDPARSFIISTHQVHDLQSLIDSVVIIDGGRILLHETLDTLATRLAVQVEFEAPLDALYAEQSLEGYRVLRENNSGFESEVDLSLLFGLVTTRLAIFETLFGRGESA